MTTSENQIVAYQPNETVRLVSGRKLIDNWVDKWAIAAFGLFAKKRRGVKESA